MAVITEPCTHAAGLQRVTGRTRGCEECTALGERWNELRVCLACGHVGCCEDSPHAHAFQHFTSTGHPLIAPSDRSETWAWCYIDRRYFELAKQLRPLRRSALAALIARFFGRSSPENPPSQK